MLVAQAPVTACQSEFQIAPIFPLMARRSGRQHIGEGGPRHAACSRGSIREKRGTRGGEERFGASRQQSCILSLFFYDYFGDCILIWGCVSWLIVPSSLLAGLLMVELPCLLLSAHVYAARHWKYVMYYCGYDNWQDVQNDVLKCDYSEV